MVNKIREGFVDFVYSVRWNLWLVTETVTDWIISRSAKKQWEKVTGRTYREVVEDFDKALYPHPRAFFPPGHKLSSFDAVWKYDDVDGCPYYIAIKLGTVFDLSVYHTDEHITDYRVDDCVKEDYKGEDTAWQLIEAVKHSEVFFDANEGK